MPLMRAPGPAAPPPPPPPPLAALLLSKMASSASRAASRTRRAGSSPRSGSSGARNSAGREKGKDGDAIGMRRAEKAQRRCEAAAQVKEAATLMGRRLTQAALYRLGVALRAAAELGPARLGHLLEYRQHLPLDGGLLRQGSDAGWLVGARSTDGAREEKGGEGGWKGESSPAWRGACRASRRACRTRLCRHA